MFKQAVNRSKLELAKRGLYRLSPQEMLDMLELLVWVEPFNGDTLVRTLVNPADGSQITEYPAAVHRNQPSRIFYSFVKDKWMSQTKHKTLYGASMTRERHLVELRAVLESNL
ncbi:hypothetical protein [Vibrio phage VCPH]|nr:hypothetical protein [Vibrio phage VCPH]